MKRKLLSLFLAMTLLLSCIPIPAFASEADQNEAGAKLQAVDLSTLNSIYDPVTNSVTVSNVPDGVIVTLGGYMNGRMVFVEIAEEHSGTVSWNLPNIEFDALKVFGLNEDYAPICEAEFVYAKQYTLTVKYVDEAGNTISDPETSAVTEGDPYTATQKTITGHVCSGLASGSDPVTGTMNGNKTVTFVYAKQYTLTVNYVDTSGGAIVKPDTTPYTEGQSYKVEAPDIAGYTCSGLALDSAPATGKMDGNKTVTFVYTQNTYTLTVNYVNTSGDAIANPDTTPYTEGQSYKVEPTDIAGYTCSGLDEGSDDAEGTMDGNKTVTFVYNTNYTLTYKWETDTGTELQTADTETIIEGDSYNVVDTPDETFDGYAYVRTDGIPSDTSAVTGDVTITYVYTLKNVTVTEPTADNITAALKNPGVETVNIGSTEDILELSGLTVPAGKTLNITSDSTKVSGAFTVEGTLNVTGTLSVENGGIMIVAGTMDVEGSLSVLSGGTVTIDVDGTLNSSGTHIVDSGGTLAINGVMNVKGEDSTFANNGEATVEQGGTLSLESGVSATNNGVMTVNGTLDIADTATLTNYGTLTDNSTNSINV